MKSLIIFTLTLISFNSFAGSSCGSVEKTFKAKYTKEGESFVALEAYYKATERAAAEGFRCRDQYRYSVTTSIFNSNKFTAIVEVDCMKYKSNCEQD